MRALKFSAAFGLGMAAALAFAPADAAPLTKEQLSRISALSQKYDPPILLAFKADPKLKEAMQADLKTIQTMKGSTRSAAILAYQRKYHDLYRKILDTANINLGSLASELHSIFPNMVFTVHDGTSIIGLAPVVPGPTTLLTGKITTVIKLGASDFRSTDTSACIPIPGVMGGNFTRTGLVLDSNADVFGLSTCEYAGQFSHDFTVPSVQTAHIDLTVDVTDTAAAYAGPGLAVATTETSMLVTGGSVTLGHLVVACAAVAPVLWVAEVDCSRAGMGSSIDIPNAGTYHLVGVVDSFACALLFSVAEAHSALNVGSATITFSLR